MRKLILAAAAVGVGAAAATKAAYAAIAVPADPAVVATLGTSTSGSETGIYTFGLAILAGVGVMLLLSITKAGGVIGAAAIALARRMR